MRIPKLSATTRIVLSLVSLSTSFLLLASVLGLFPDRRKDILNDRAHLCEALAINFSALARQADVTSVQHCFETVVNRNPQIASLGMRTKDGRLLIEVGEHQATWRRENSRQSTESQMVVPVYAKEEQWGSLEVRFRPLDAPGWLGVISRPEFRLAAFMSVVTLVSYSLFLRKVLRQLNPSKVIPGRVREAFDSLAEGILVMDQNERVVLANRAFEQATGKPLEQLLGQNASELPFVNRDDTSNTGYPWQETISSAQAIRGRLLGLSEGVTDGRTYSVSSAPIIDETGRNRGALASFEDVSKLEKKKEELRVMVEHLHASAEHIKKQNRELEIMATRDPLTGCFNRRSFLEQFESAWKAAERYEFPLAVTMVDIDHFKSINDVHGHQAGDEVLRKVAQVLCETARESDVVCRFGGEEFVILLPQTDLAAAAVAAERYRRAIETLNFDRLSVTASLGVSAKSENPRDPQDLLDQADKSLYVAKRSGRNQVVQWDEVLTGGEKERSEPLSSALSETSSDESSIPFHAVAALISALAYRDPETASHSRRVADLCVTMAEGLLSLRDCYVLEIAALLHDIGKIGVPDAILLKPGALTDDEWKIMRGHERIGVEIIRASFNSLALSQIVEHHHAYFGGDPLQPGAPSGRAIPVGARILAIADAFDAMISDRVYRKGRSREEAVAELRRCQGVQFDPELVERFVRAIEVRAHDVESQTIHLSTEAARSVGAQIERLVTSLEVQDLAGMSALSQRLSATATKYGASEIAQVSQQLDSSIQGDCDLLEIMHTANELLDLCRATQDCFLHRST